jgi:hypothetical protein
MHINRISVYFLVMVFALQTSSQIQATWPNINITLPSRREMWFALGGACVCLSGVFLHHLWTKKNPPIEAMTGYFNTVDPLSNDGMTINKDKYNPIYWIKRKNDYATLYQTAYLNTQRYSYFLNQPNNKSNDNIDKPD